MGQHGRHRFEPKGAHGEAGLREMPFGSRSSGLSTAGSAAARSPLAYRAASLGGYTRDGHGGRGSCSSVGCAFALGCPPTEFSTSCLEGQPGLTFVEKWS